MNVIIANKNKDLFSNLDVDIIKSEYGEFTVEEIIASFSNFFFNKMFLDITAIKNFENLANIQKLSMNLNVEKIIFYLDELDSTNNSNYISSLISMGIYNFTRNYEGIMYLYQHPNSYRDVAHLQSFNGGENNTHKFGFEKVGDASNEFVSSGSAKIIGFKNVTLHAGATTLIYIINKVLSSYKNVIAIEVDKKDFTYFRDNSLISVSDSELSGTINKHKNSDIILIDLNNSKCDYLCNEVIYLIEPSTIKLNRLMIIDRDILKRLMGKKVVLNKSLLDDSDISAFEFESGIKLFASIPPLNDKNTEFECLSSFLNKLEID